MGWRWGACTKFRRLIEDFALDEHFVKSLRFWLQLPEFRVHQKNEPGQKVLALFKIFLNCFIIPLIFFLGLYKSHNIW